MNFTKIQSKREAYKFVNIEKLLDDVKDYKYAIIYKLNCVETLHISDANSKKITDFLEVRAFNEKGELRVIRVGDNDYRGRIRTDEIGDCIEIIDESHLLWGNKIENEDNYTLLSEDRGTRLKLPLDVEKKQRAFVKVRNYLDKEIFEFNDWRMIDFFAMEVKEYAIYPK